MPCILSVIRVIVNKNNLWQLFIVKGYHVHLMRANSYHLFDFNHQYYRITGIKQWKNGTNTQLCSWIRRISSLMYVIFKTDFPLGPLCFISTHLGGCNIVNLSHRWFNWIVLSARVKTPSTVSISTGRGTPPKPSRLRNMRYTYHFAA